MLGHGAIGQFAIGQVGAGAAEFIGPDKWMPQFGEPVRFKRGVKVSAQQFTAFNPQPVVSFSWFEGLTEPVRKKRRSPAALAPYHFWQPAPSPFVATGWYSPLSEPVRKKPALRPGLQQFFTTDPEVIPITKLIGWFGPLSEPVRHRAALRRALQQYLAWPSQLRPTPALTGVLDALETKDVFLGAAAVFNRPQSGELGVIEDRSTGGETGLSREPAAISARMSISII